MNNSSVYLMTKRNSWRKTKLNDDETWKGKSRLWGDGTHRISSYIAMFTPAFANYFIKKYTSDSDTVLDTFSGRGTTLLEARILGRKSYAIDLNPLAYVLSRAKATSFKIDEILNRIDQLEEEYKKTPKIKNLDHDMEIYYSKHNLEQITFLKYKLGINWQSLSDIDNYILAILLGIMHGPMRKDGDSIYLSLSMSNHTSMSKNYVKRYAKNHGLKKPVFNVFEKIADRAKKVIGNSKYCSNDGHVVYGNALELKKHFRDIYPDFVLTSPPYLNIVNYTNSNWIKMWMLGYETSEDNKQIGLDDKHSFNDYLEFMRDYFESLSHILKKNSTLALVIGDVKRNDKVYSFEDVWKIIKNEFPKFSLEEIYVDNISQEHKATNSLGCKSGMATRNDKVYVFKIK